MAFSSLVKQMRVLLRSQTLVQASVSLVLQLVHAHSKPPMKSMHLEMRNKLNLHSSKPDLFLALAYFSLMSHEFSRHSLISVSQFLPV